MSIFYFVLKCNLYIEVLLKNGNNHICRNNRIKRFISVTPLLKKRIELNLLSTYICTYTYIHSHFSTNNVSIYLFFYLYRRRRACECMYVCMRAKRYFRYCAGKFRCISPSPSRGAANREIYIRGNVSHYCNYRTRRHPLVNMYGPGARIGEEETDKLAYELCFTLAR